MSVCPGTNSLLFKRSPKVHKQKKCPTSGSRQYSLWVHSEAFLSWICDLLSESFNFCEQKALWEKKAWGWGVTLESVFSSPLLLFSSSQQVVLEFFWPFPASDWGEDQGRVKPGHRHVSLLAYFTGVEQLARHHLGTVHKKETPYSWCPLSPLEIFLLQHILYNLQWWRSF